MSYSKNEYFKLYPSCIIVKGYKRSIIIDTDNRKIHYIENNHYKLIEKLQEKSILEIFSREDNTDDFLFLDYLIRNDFGQVLKKEYFDNFLPIDDEVQIPFSTNSIVDIECFNFDSIKIIIEKLDIAKITNVQFRFLNDISIKDFEKIIHLLDLYSFYSVELLISNTFYSTLSEERISLIERNQLITKVFIFGFQKELLNRESKFLFLASPLNEHNLCGHISIKYFSSFIETVINSKRYNSCLSCKISIDKNGQVKNCPSMKKEYGDIKDISLVEILNNKSFQIYNNITKDNIDVCKDCEYRYVCSDCRAYIDNTEDIYSRPAKCTYNPYIAKWKEEEGYQTLEECGVTVTEEGHSIDHQKIEAINEKLWLG